MKSLSILAILFFFAVNLRAETGRAIFGESIKPELNYSSATCSDTTIRGVNISSFSGTELYMITITSPSATSFFQVFDASGSVAPGVPGATDTARIVTGPIIASPARDINFRRQLLKNGLSVNINSPSGVSPCLHILYNSR